MPQLDPVRERLLASILERSANDREFRQDLISRPDEAIRSAFGIRIPEGYRIKFVERDPSFDSMVVLPDLVATGDAELSLDELEAVAGGTDPVTPPYEWSGGGTG
ncbi:MAG TPA: NHLP leader peptide family RiPP precursor [Longimicrobiaceae bacterium]|nr:NHLP leader peptide family RiPP precursor [Longimicrobiaceae bacterium]